MRKSELRGLWDLTSSLEMQSLLLFPGPQWEQTLGGTCQPKAWMLAILGGVINTHLARRLLLMGGVTWRGKPAATARK